MSLTEYFGTNDNAAGYEVTEYFLVIHCETLGYREEAGVVQVIMELTWGYNRGAAYRISFQIPETWAGWYGYDWDWYFTVQGRYETARVVGRIAFNPHNPRFPPARVLGSGIWVGWVLEDEIEEVE